MKALRAHAPLDYRLDEIETPEAGPGEVLARVLACGICAGDLKAHQGGIRIWGTGPEDRYIEAPVTGGHEFVGEVVAVGDGVTSCVPGDRVIAEQIVPCEACAYCRASEQWLCVESAVFGFKQHCAGGFAEYVKLPPTSIIHVVPAGMTDAQASLVEPIACGFHAVDQAGITSDDVVVVAGLGGIGLAMVSIVAGRLPRLVIGVDVRADRLAQARDFGADIVFNPTECDLGEEIRALTGGLGCDVYLEASGSQASVNQALESLRNRGRLVQMGVFADLVTADWNIIGDGKELRIFGSHLSGTAYSSVIKGIASGRIRTDGLVTHTFPLEQWEEAFNVAQGGEGALKVLLAP